MNVLMILQGNFPPDSRVRKEAKSLLAAGHEVRVLCLSDKPEVETVDGTEVHRFSRSKVGDWKEGVHRLHNLMLKNIHPLWKKEIQTQLRDDFDVVHVHDLPLARTALKVTDLPVVLDLHENYKEAVYHYRESDTLSDVLFSRRKITQRLFKPAWRYKYEQQAAMERSEHVIAVVSEAKEAYTCSGIPEEKITVVSNTVDLDWFDQYLVEDSALETDQFTLTYVGSLSGHHRGLDTAISAMPKIRSEIPSAKMRIAGGGHLKQKLKALARNLGVREHVEFTGWIDETEFPRYMKAADVGIIPHRSSSHTNTTVPHKLFQYMAAELPVLATETTAISRIVNETESGIIVPPEDPERFAKASIRIAQSSKNECFGINGRTAVENKYNWDFDGDRLKEVYGQIG